MTPEERRKAMEERLAKMTPEERKQFEEMRAARRAQGGGGGQGSRRRDRAPAGGQGLAAAQCGRRHAAERRQNAQAPQGPDATSPRD